ncbi:hypothetical protein AAVH_18853 [Aphelenchoides avenae]|nr:hypothetical protein AAVH_18853 [Aphelenchus avenae]
MSTKKTNDENCYNLIQSGINSVQRGLDGLQASPTKRRRASSPVKKNVDGGTHQEMDEAMLKINQIREVYVEITTFPDLSPAKRPRGRPKKTSSGAAGACADGMPQPPPVQQDAPPPPPPPHQAQPNYYAPQPHYAPAPMFYPPPSPYYVVPPPPPPPTSFYVHHQAPPVLQQAPPPDPLMTPPRERRSGLADVVDFNLEEYLSPFSPQPTTSRAAYGGNVLSPTFNIINTSNAGPPPMFVAGAERAEADSSGDGGLHRDKT